MYIMEQRRNYLFFGVNVCTALMMSVIINLSIKVLPYSFTDAGALVANWKVLSFSFIFKVLLIAADLLIVLQLIKRFIERRSRREKSPASLNRKLQNFFISCFSRNTMIPAGVLLCLLLLLINISLNFKSCIRRPLLIVLIVDLLIWGTQMIATPTSLMFRYSFFFLLTLPVLMVLVISAIKSPAGEIQYESYSDSDCFYDSI